LYFGQPKERRAHSAVDTMEYHDYEIRRIVNLGFKLAEPRRKQLMSVDKANVLESSRYWREIAIECSQDFPNVKLDHMLVDTAAMRLVMSPAQFDVIVTENTFGDILTDEAAVLVGSMGLLPSASLGDDAVSRRTEETVGMKPSGRDNAALGTRGVYEPIHGSAPDIAGKGIANPIGTILSAAMLLRYSLNLPREAEAVERAVDRALSDGCRTADIAHAQRNERVLKTPEMTDEILKRLE
jgi:3-isopropylmalate dehydrogenase